MLERALVLFVYVPIHNLFRKCMYTWEFSLDKSFAGPQVYLYITESFGRRFFFANVVKLAISCMLLSHRTKNIA